MKMTDSCVMYACVCMCEIAYVFTGMHVCQCEHVCMSRYVCQCVCECVCLCLRVCVLL